MNSAPSVESQSGGSLHVRFLRIRELLARRGLSRSSHFRDIEAGLWPPPITIGPRCSVYPEHEADLILRAQVAGATADEIRTLVQQLVTARAQMKPALGKVA